MYGGRKVKTGGKLIGYKVVKKMHDFTGRVYYRSPYQSFDFRQWGEYYARCRSISALIELTERNAVPVIGDGAFHLFQSLDDAKDTVKSFQWEEQVANMQLNSYNSVVPENWVILECEIDPSQAAYVFEGNEAGKVGVRTWASSMIRVLKEAEE